MGTRLTVDAVESGRSPVDASRSPLIGRSLTMNGVREIATDVARRRTTVMIFGPTGSGKEMVARHIHAHSDRAHGPFVPLDCTALTESLSESELFGHVRGAFSGATQDSLGILRAADGGTLLLDELGELPLPLQAKLLRVLQERRVTPVGSSRSYAIDVRVLCATHRDLGRMVRERTFREDLFNRLNVVAVHVPPLAARVEDVLELAAHFLELQATLYEEPLKRLTPAAEAALVAHDWPGNVRELANVIERAHVLSRAQAIDVADLPERFHSRPDAAARDTAAIFHLPTIERDTIREALRHCSNNKAAAGRLLGLNVQRLKRRMKMLDVPIDA